MSNQYKKHGGVTLLKKGIISTSMLVSLLCCGSSFASGNAISGQLMIINNMGNVNSASNIPGASASSFTVSVNDSTGTPCHTAGLVYNGYVVIQWYATGLHSSSYCVGAPTSIVITTLKKIVGGVSTAVYDSTASGVPIPDVSPTPATLSAPTPGSATCGAFVCSTSYENMAVIITGDGTPSSPVAASSTSWESLGASVPSFDATSGFLTGVGVFGLLGVMDLKAEALMRQYGLTPHRGGLVHAISKETPQ